MGIIIYAPEDVEKNKKFIRLCSENLKEYGIELKTVVLKDKHQRNLMESIHLETCNILFAINRSRNHWIACQLEQMGIRVFNDSGVTEIGNDKWKTYLYARAQGIPVMETKKETESDKDFLEQYPVVVKSRDGHGGTEVFLVRDTQQMQEAVQKIGRDYIVQKVADTRGQDIRAYVIGGEIVLAMKRSAAAGFHSNFSLGGTAVKYELKREELNVIERVISDLKPDYAGIDIIYDGDRPVLNEIEDAVGARMVYQNTNVDIIRMYIGHIANVMGL